jgi:hypothetical protein
LAPAASLEFDRLKAKLDQKQQEYSKLPGVLRITSASTRSAEHAAYLRYWIDRIEMIGNNNYPPAEMKQRDKLEVIRTWRFIPGNRLNTEN